jgi:hypothetical protein
LRPLAEVALLISDLLHPFDVLAIYVHARIS